MTCISTASTATTGVYARADKEAERTAKKMGLLMYLDELLLLELDGLEAFSSYHTSEQAAYYSSLTDKRNLLSTCGSDYHGKTKPSITLGEAAFAQYMEPEKETNSFALP